MRQHFHRMGWKEQQVAVSGRLKKKEFLIAIIRMRNFTTKVYNTSFYGNMATRQCSSAVFSMLVQAAALFRPSQILSAPPQHLYVQYAYEMYYVPKNVS